MKRWAWNLFCLFSLLVFVSSVTIWVRSYFVADIIAWESNQQDRRIQLFTPPQLGVTVFSTRGKLRILGEMTRYKVSVPWTPRWIYRGYSSPPSMRSPAQPGEQMRIAFAGFEYLRCSIGPPYYQNSKIVVMLPLWLFLPAAVPPFLWWRKWRKKGGRGFPVSVAEERQMQ